MFNRILMTLPLLASMACAPANDTAVTDGDAISKTAKVDVCHHEGDGTYQIINVSGNALDAHVDNHGDWLVAANDVTADGIDDDCDGEIDEDASNCLCTDEIDVAGTAADLDGYSTCYDLDDYYYDLYTYYEYGYQSTGTYAVSSLYVYDFRNGPHSDYYGDYGCGASAGSSSAGDYTATPGIIPLTEAQYDSCIDAVDDLRAENGCDYSYSR